MYVVSDFMIENLTGDNVTEHWGPIPPRDS